jgi:CheY-like chemotaxis protein
MYDAPVLIVEDEPDGQELIQRMLSQVNIPVEVAGNAEDAWQMLNARRFIAVIIDLALPGKDGFELLSSIRQSDHLQHLPCVAVTAFHTPELKQRAIADGFNAYFAKPLDRTRFLGELDKTLLAM